MSYFSGITDPELIEEGWSPDQIAELRRAEKGVEAKRKIAAENRLQEDLDALSDRGKRIYYELISGPFAWDPNMAASAARAAQEPIPKPLQWCPQDHPSGPKMFYAFPPEHKWWQFWKP